MSTISVPEHLWEVLLPLLKLDIDSPELQSLLREHIKENIEDTSPEVPYELITGIAKWGQSEAGRIILENDGLDPRSYTLIPLLAGTTFAPSSKPPPPPRPEVDSSEDRRAITALINGLFSVVGVGFAAWWAARISHWSNETSILLALTVSIIVATAEGILYAIWNSHREKRKQMRQKMLKSKLEPKPGPVKTDEKEIELREEAQGKMVQRKGYEYQEEEGSTGL